jgi:DNA primase
MRHLPNPIDPARVLNAVAERFQQALSGSPAQSYLEHRGVQPSAAQAFGLGWCAPSVMDYIDTRSVDHPCRSVLLESGLINVTDSKTTYPLAGRLTFPLRSASGATLGFGGRSIGTAWPKYRNTRATGFFAKNTFLFGLDRARHSIESLREAIIVEGYLDAVLLHQAGMTNTVATLGTTLSPVQVEHLIELGVDRITLLFDEDSAGRTGTARALESFFVPLAQREVSVCVGVLPPGANDPGEAVQAEHSAALRRAVQQPMSPLEFYCTHASTLAESDPHCGARVLRLLLEGLTKAAGLPGVETLERALAVNPVANEFKARRTRRETAREKGA